MSYRDPSPEDLKRPEFEAIWQAIKHWDINVPDKYRGYCGATGNHVMAILDAVESRVKELEAELEHIRFVTGRSGCEIVDRLADAERTREERDALKAKLAQAVEGLREMSELARRMGV